MQYKKEHAQPEIDAHGEYKEQCLESMLTCTSKEEHFQWGRIPAEEDPSRGGPRRRKTPVEEDPSREEPQRKKIPAEKDPTG